MMTDEKSSSDNQSRRSKALAAFFYLAFLTFVSFRVNGHDFGGGDHPIHLPVVFQMVNPSLYPGDQFVAGARAYPSVFWKGFALLLAFSPDRLIEAAQAWELALFILTRFLLLWGLFRLARIVAKHPITPWLVPALAIPFNVVPWGGTNFFETGLETSSVGLMLAVHATAFLLQKKYWAWGIVMGFAGAVHPMVAGHAAAPMMLWLACEREILREKRFWIAGVSGMAVSLILLGIGGALHGSLSSIPREDWLFLARLRLTHHFYPFSWSQALWIAMAVVVGVAAIVRQFLPPDHPARKPALVWMTSGAIFSLANILFGGIYPVPALLRACLWREWLVVVPFIFALWVEGFATVIIRTSDEVRSVMIVTILLLSGLAWAVSVGIISDYEARWWREVGSWLQENAPKTATILTPPDQTRIRIWSLRSTWVEWKDGSALLWDPKWTRDVWLPRLDRVGLKKHPVDLSLTPEILSQFYDTQTSQTLSQLASEEAIDWAVLRRDVGSGPTKLPGGYWAMKLRD